MSGFWAPRVGTHRPESRADQTFPGASVGLEVKAWRPMGLFPGLETWRNLPCCVLNLLETSGPLVPHLGLGSLSPACPTFAFWKQLTCFLVSQVPRGRGILSQEGSYPGPHPYLV